MNTETGQNVADYKQYADQICRGKHFLMRDGVTKVLPIAYIAHICNVDYALIDYHFREITRMKFEGTNTPFVKVEEAAATLRNVKRRGRPRKISLKARDLKEPEEF